jgi:hypothetical protein
MELRCVDSKLDYLHYKWEHNEIYRVKNQILTFRLAIPCVGRSFYSCSDVGTIYFTIVERSYCVARKWHIRRIREKTNETRRTAEYQPDKNGEVAELPVLLVEHYLLTPWSGVLPEKLKRPELLKKFPAFYGTRRFITAFTRVRHLSLS